MQKTFQWLTVLTVLMSIMSFVGPPAQAEGLQSGIHGMAWGGHAADYPHLMGVREEGAAAYYVDRNKIYHAVGQPVSAVIYGFYRDRLFAAYIKLSSPNQAYYLERHFSTEYGPARVTSAGSGAQTVYRWEDDDLKIKLKISDADDEIKLGIYYQPLSNELNQTLAEEGPSDVGDGPSPSDDQAAESAPLL